MRQRNASCIWEIEEKFAINLQNFNSIVSGAVYVRQAGLLASCPANKPARIYVGDLMVSKFGYW